MQNQKIIAFAQTVFYSCMVVVLPLLVSALGVDGALYSVLPTWFTQYGLTGAIIFVLNYYENKIQNSGKGALFGAIQD